MTQEKEILEESEVEPFKSTAVFYFALPEDCGNPKHKHPKYLTLTTALTELELKASIPGNKSLSDEDREYIRRNNLHLALFERIYEKNNRIQFLLHTHTQAYDSLDDITGANVYNMGNSKTCDLSLLLPKLGELADQHKKAYLAQESQVLAERIAPDITDCASEHDETGVKHRMYDLLCEILTAWNAGANYTLGRSNGRKTYKIELAHATQNLNKFFEGHPFAKSLSTYWKLCTRPPNKRDNTSERIERFVEKAASYQNAA